MAQDAIKVAGLAKRYERVTAVDGIDFAVPRGAVVGLLGGNGAGKTTTISMLLGLLVPSAGTIEVLGENMLTHRHRVLPRLNFSSPYVDLPNRLTVSENLLVYAGLYGIERPRRHIDALIEALDLGEFVHRATGQLSSGQKTRAALAKALLNQPEVLLLDEPTASLDPDTADWVRSYLIAYQHATGASILLASHNMAEVERMCSEVLMMKAGKIVDRGPPPDLIAHYGRETLEQVFLDIARQGTPAEGGLSAAAQ